MKQTDAQIEVVSLFPLDGPNAIALSQDRLRELSVHYSELYRQLVSECARSLSSQFGTPPPAASILAREALVPLTHFFMDRLLRLSMAGSRRLRLPGSNGVNPTYPDDLDEFKVQAQLSPGLNRKLSLELAPILGIEIERQDRQAARVAGTSSGPIVNHNFGGASRAQRLKQRLILEFQRRFDSCRGRIPTLSMAYSTDALARLGFYSTHLFDVRGRLVVEHRSKDPSMRDSFFRTLVGRIEDPVGRFLEGAGGGFDFPKGAVLDVFRRFLQEAYPPKLLEASAVNLSNATAVLEPMNAPALINSEAGSLEATYLHAAARSLGMKIIGCQHGGLYGYIEDHTLAWELEYGVFDYFITWGWTEMPALPVCSGVKAIPLPSPWLSERGQHLRETMADLAGVVDSESFDFLLMSNKIYPFPPAPSGAAICRSDRLRELTVYLSQLVSECAAEGIRILHKPYNEWTVRTYPDLFEKLERLGGSSYERLGTGEKGLNRELLGRCRVVLWDQPGTGLLECLAGGVPTMVLWPRVYTQEVESAVPAFRELESAGWVHRSTDSLIREYRLFRAAPQEWMNEPRRVEAARSFTSRYGRTSRDWAAPWSECLSRIASRRFDEIPS